VAGSTLNWTTCITKINWLTVLDEKLLFTPVMMMMMMIMIIIIIIIITQKRWRKRTDADRRSLHNRSY
jgi:hypothetical protein